MEHPPPVGPWDCTAEQYHADDEWIGSSMVKRFIERGPTHYHRLYVSHEQPKPVPISDMIFGTGFHLAALQPELFETQVVRGLEGLNLKSSKDRAKRDQFAADNHGKIILPPEEYDSIEPMLQATLACPGIAELLHQGGRIEQGYRWINEESGVPCKALIDILNPGEETPHQIVDLKTSSDPQLEAFSRDAYNYGYHISGVHYCEAIVECLGEPEPEYLLVVVDKRPPYTEPAIYRFGPREWGLGRHRRQLALNQLGVCYEYQEWTPDHYGEVREIAFPGWAFHVRE